MNITIQEMKVAQKVGARIASRWAAVDQDDVISHLYLWMAENQNALDRWRVEESGEGKLYVSLRREAAKFCAAETQAGTVRPIRTDNFYSPELLTRALPFVFEDTPVTTAVEHPTSGQALYSGGPTGHSVALTVMADIRGTFYGLNAELREILEWRFRDGLTLEEIGELTGLSKVGAKKRIDRAIQRLCDGLAGEKLGF